MVLGMIGAGPASKPEALQNNAPAMSAEKTAGE
jgi:hypothetical protein